MLKTSKLLGLANVVIRSRRIRIALVAVELGVLLVNYKKRKQAKHDAEVIKDKLTQ